MFGSKHTPSLRAKIASALTSFCSPPIPSPTFTTPLRFKPCGSAENTSTVQPSIASSKTPSIAPAKASCTAFLPAADWPASQRSQLCSECYIVWVIPLTLFVLSRH